MTKYLNTYNAQVAPIDTQAIMQIPPEKYDFNFVFDVGVLRSDRIELRPFVPSLHAQLLYDGLAKNPETTRWLPFDALSLDDVVKNVETRRRDPTSLQYAIYTDAPGADTPPTDPSEYSFAGTLSCINSSPTDLSAEPGWIVVLPEFQRTHVLTHSAGTLLRHVFTPLSEGGLGLRRCQWFTTSLNTASQNAGLRLGFKLEGILRNHRILPPGKEGVRDGRPGDGKPGQMSRDSWLASITWMEWEESVKVHIDALMARSLWTGDTTSH